MVWGCRRGILLVRDGHSCPYLPLTLILKGHSQEGLV